MKTTTSLSKSQLSAMGSGSITYERPYAARSILTVFADCQLLPVLYLRADCLLPTALDASDRSSHNACLSAQAGFMARGPAPVGSRIGKPGVTKRSVTKGVDDS